jgi:photosystem II stability/assembly factor-like uncharacterized protein
LAVRTNVQTFGIACIAALSAATLHAASWTAVNSGLAPTPANPISIAISAKQPSTLYTRASTFTGCCKLFKSTDGAATWKPVTSIAGVYAIFTDPQSDSTVYAITPHGILKSTDGANTWTNASNGLGDAYVNTLLIDPASTATLYASTGKAIFKSADAGASWNALDTGLPSNSFISSFVIDATNPSQLYAVAAIPQQQGPAVVHLLKTVDAGDTWTQAAGAFPPNSSFTALTISSTAPSVLFATTPPGPAGTNILKSTDGGESWTAVNTGLPPGIGIESVVIDPTDSSTIYLPVTFPVAEAGGILKSTDGGQTWTAIKPDGPANTPVRSLSLDPLAPSTMYVLSDGTWLKSTDGGTTWKTANAGLSTLETNALAVNSLDPGTVYATTGASIYKSVTGGATWDRLFEFHLYMSSTPSGPPGISPFFPDGAPTYPVSLTIDYSNPNNVYVLTARDNGCYFADNLFFKSTDGGATWSDRVSPRTSGCIFGGFFGVSGGFKGIDPVDPNTLYAAEADDEDIGYALLESKDGGADWTNVAAFPGGLEAGVWSLAVDPRTSMTLYAGMDDVPVYSDFDNSVTAGPAGVWKTTDGGMTWAAVGLNGLAVNLLLIDPRQTDVLYAAAQGHYASPRGYRGLFKSVDGGAHWSSIDVGLEKLSQNGAVITSVILDPADSATLYIGTSGDGVYKSADGGGHWAALNDGLTSLDVRALAIAPGSGHSVFAGTSEGVFKILDASAQ